MKMNDKRQKFSDSGFVSTSIREIQRFLSDDESVMIWSDEWRLNSAREDTQDDELDNLNRDLKNISKDDNISTNYVDEENDSLSALVALVNGIPEEYDDLHTKNLIEVAQSVIAANSNKRRTLREGIYLSPEECEHLEDALQEWKDVVGCKDCEILREEEGYDSEVEQKGVGLDYERYSDLMNRLSKCIKGN
tara:strand:- start:2332 stop:2907 length:576 start_codon:yes stop_codon:yes gene_type:complete